MSVLTPPHVPALAVLCSCTRSHATLSHTVCSTLVSAAFNYLETGDDPYGEVAIALPVVHGKKPPVYLPLIAGMAWQGFGNLVLRNHPVVKRCGSWTSIRCPIMTVSYLDRSAITSPRPEADAAR